ncbi:carboxypeptidase regulatory-like domain-containing protein [Sphingobacterium sp. DR205]|uniref:TonB-dependent receptor n=1 Tax=Sphingobacterium sp. DR205 TaxID=2713573 RepID=UPI0013E41067|nr:carboxypeptidase regulatory-like domain-containing protein [Sphingobacterium sp. DR205]QIH32532.1 TonB-dependent receptor [Sphingobacterium sp. DR205]
MKRSLLFFALVMASYGAVQAQVTTSSMTGVVTQTNGTKTTGATIKAVHVPSGTVYSSSSNEAGRFSLPGMRVGGPYRVEVTYVGQNPVVYENVYLQLGRDLELNPVFGESATVIDEVTVTRTKKGQNLKTGASTSISNRQLQTLPTISRGLNDFTRLTPQADIKGDALSIGGMNNRFNQLTIDGAVSNDVFGLSSGGTNGASTGVSPISLDAIEEMTVQIAPFDVRAGGFAGGGISAVTRSGTNKPQASVYYFTRNQNLTGKTPYSLISGDQQRKKLDNFSEKQYGVRVGGPIIKDKLFFFLNYEKTENNTPLGFAPGVDGSKFTVAELEQIANRAKALGYDAGSFLDQESNNKSDKIFTRFDYNINEKHKLSARYSYVKGSATDLSRSQTALTFSNGAILRESTTNSAVLELNSRFSNTLSNNLVIGYTKVSEPRSAPGNPFPRVTLQLGDRNVNLGTEPFSTVNQLDQDVFTLTDNLTVYKGNHRFTFGTHNEFYKMYNGFIGSAFGNYTFSNSPATDINPVTGKSYTAIENFERGLASSFQYNYSNTDDPRQGADFKAMQLGFYIQDDYQLADNFKLTGGIRVDIPMYLTDPMENTDFNNSILAKRYDVMTNRMPQTTFMWSPRLGFNWDIKGDRSAILRGGLGIFTSRFPFVWSAGAYTQSGALLGGNQLNAGSGNAPNIDFIADPNNQPKSNQEVKPSGNISVLDKNLRLPQIARTSLGFDYRLPWDIQGTAEFMYSKNLSSFKFTDLNMKDPVGQLEGADNRLLYGATNAEKRVLPNYTQVIYINNVNQGYSWSATAQLSKSFASGFFGSLAYTYTESKDLFSGSSSQNQSNFFRTATVNGSNSVTLGHNPFSTGSRIIGFASYTKEYLGHLGTTLSLVYNGQSGARFSYLITGDPGRYSAGSASDQFSLMYIPRDKSEIRFVQNGNQTPDDQWDAFNQFIEANPYLKNRRGKYAERNGDKTPFSHRFDLKILQDVFTNIGNTKNKIQISLDIMNVGALINKKWGEQYSGGGSFWDNSFRAIAFDSFVKDTKIPQYKLGDLNKNNPYFVSDVPSRWSAQIGIRYIFN